MTIPLELTPATLTTSAPVDIYVRSTGSDTAAGTMGNPIRTLLEVDSVLRIPMNIGHRVTVHLRGETYALPDRPWWLSGRTFSGGGYLEIVVDASSRFRIALDDPTEADSFGFVDENDQTQALFVRVESHTISTPSVEIHDGHSGVVQTREGRHIVVLFAGGEEVRRLEVDFVAGGVHEVRL